MNSTTDPAPTERDIDEQIGRILDKFAEGEYDRREGFGSTHTLTKEEAKQAIATHYRQKFEKLIGEDEPLPILATAKKATNEHKRNEFRAQLRAKLKEEL